MITKNDWERCVAFHGHECGGLAIGFQAARCVEKLLGLTYSDNEQTVCIAENDACGVDAIQVLLGCSIGKGNLLFRMRGKQAFSFYNRATGQSVRLVLRERPDEISREDSLAYFLSLEPEAMFTVEPTRTPLPESARLFRSYRCTRCGETTGENWVRLVDGKPYCLDCFASYDRFDV